MAAYMGILTLAKDKDTPVTEKLKLLKYAWVKHEVAIPNKHQEIVDFLCALIVNKARGQLKEEDEILVWQSLNKFLAAGQSSINVKPAISKAVTENIRYHTPKKSGSDGKKDTRFLSHALECGSLLLSTRFVPQLPFSSRCHQLVALLQLCLSRGCVVLEKAQALVKSLVAVMAYHQSLHPDQKEVLFCISYLFPVFMEYYKVHDDPQLRQFVLTSLFHSTHKKAHAFQFVPRTANTRPRVKHDNLRDIYPRLFYQPCDSSAMASFAAAFVAAFLKQNSADASACFAMLQHATTELLIKKGKDDPDPRMSLSCLDKYFQSWVSVGCTAMFTIKPVQQFANWLQEVFEFVLPHNHDPSWYGFMSSLLTLKRAVIEESLVRILNGAVKQVEAESKETRAARDAFLSKLVTIFQRLRRVPYFLQSLIHVILKGNPIAVNNPSLVKFRESLNVMFTEVPIASVTAMWTEIKARLETAIPPSNNSKERANKQSWLLHLLNSLLSNTQFFDQRSMAMMGAKLRTLLADTESNVLKPLSKQHNMDEMPVLEDTLVTWAYVKMLLYPRWREQAASGGVDVGDGVVGSRDARKLIKKVPVPTKIRLILQRQQVLTSGDNMDKGDNYQESREEVNGLVAQLLESLTTMYVTRHGDDAANNQPKLVTLLQEFMDLFPVISHCLTDELVERWADAIVNTVWNETKRANAVSHLHDERSRNNEPLYGVIQHFLRHPATLENQRLQTHLACKIWSKLLVMKSTASPRKKKRRMSSSAEDNPDVVSKMYQFITDAEIESADFVLSPDQISNTLTIAEQASPDFVQLLSCLSVEFLPLLCLKTQLGLLSMAACLPSAGHSRKDGLTTVVDDSLIWCLSDRDLAPLFSCITPDKFLQFSFRLCSQPFNMSQRYLKCSTAVVMNKHNRAAILSIGLVVEQFTEGMSCGGDMESMGRQILSATSLVHSYGQCEIFKKKGVATAARNIFYLLSKAVFKNVAGWLSFKGSRMDTDDDNDSNALQKKKKEMKTKQKLLQSQKAGKKRKRTWTEADDDEDNALETMEINEDESQTDVFLGRVVDCVTAILMVWSPNYSDDDMNGQLAGAIRCVHERLMEEGGGHGGRLDGGRLLSEQTKLLRLNFLKAVCECQKRLCQRNNDSLPSSSSSSKGDQSGAAATTASTSSPLSAQQPPSSTTSSSSSSSSPSLFSLFDDKSILDLWQDIFTLASSELSTFDSRAFGGRKKHDNVIIQENETSTVSSVTEAKTFADIDKNNGEGIEPQYAGTARERNTSGHRKTPSEFGTASEINVGNKEMERESSVVNKTPRFNLQDSRTWPKQVTLCLDIMLDIVVIVQKDDQETDDGDGGGDCGGSGKVLVGLLAYLMEHLKWTPELDHPSVLISLSVWTRLATSNFVIKIKRLSVEIRDQIYQVLTHCSSLLQHLNHRRLNYLRKGEATPTHPASSKAEAAGDLTPHVCRFIINSISTFTMFAKNTDWLSKDEPSLMLVCLQVAPSLNLVGPRDIQALQLLVNNVLFFHPKTSVIAISAVLALVSKLVCACVRQGSQFRLRRKTPKDVATLVDCARKVSRVLVCLTEGTMNLKEEVSKLGHCVLGDYVTELQKGPLHPEVKRELVGGLYQLLNVCGHSYLAAMNAALPPEGKETFRFMHREFQRFYKYRHAV